MEKNDYREKIIEMVKNMENTKIIKLIYDFVYAAYKEDKAGR